MKRKFRPCVSSAAGFGGLFCLCTALPAAEINFEVAAPARPYYGQGYFLRPLPYGPRPALAGAVEAALDRTPGVDVQRRGAAGAQADLTLRGSSYQQALVLIDGVRVSDPQTAHHSLDLPFPAQEIESVAALPGPQAAGFGAGAFGGAVEIRTRRPSANSLTAGLGAGDYSSRSASLSCERTLRGFGQRFTGWRSSDGGARPGTDLDSGGLFYRAALDRDWGALDLSVGLTEKDFGAAGFYSTVTREERERTRTRFVSLEGRIPAVGLTLEPRVYRRAHHDRFSYLYNSSAYANVHDTDLSGAGLTLRRSYGNAAAQLGGEYYGEKIDSGTMGRHSAGVAALKGGWDSPLGGGFGLSATLRADRHTSWGWQASPGLRAGWDGGRGLKAWTGAALSFRPPSFTELYYNDPGNRGDAGLKPEKCASYEAGADWSPGGVRLRAAVYRRDESRLIDWVKTSSGSPWTARNIGDVTVHGAEGSVEAALGAARAELGWSFIYKESSVPYVSKYAMRYPRAKGSLSFSSPLLRGTAATLDLLAVKRENETGYFLAGAGLAGGFGRLKAAIELSNILDTAYEEVPGAPAPGRRFWFSLGYAFI